MATPDDVKYNRPCEARLAACEAELPHPNYNKDYMESQRSTHSTENYYKDYMESQRSNQQTNYHKPNMESSRSTYSTRHLSLEAMYDAFDQFHFERNGSTTDGPPARAVRFRW